MDELVRMLLAPLRVWRLDGVSLVFLVPALVVPVLAAIGVPRYLDQPRYAHQNRTRFWLPYVLFVAGMAGAVLAADLVAFLVCWEIMTLASYAVVAYENRDPAVLRAAFKYFVMTHVGAAGLLFAAVLLRVTGGSFAFDRIPATLAHLAATWPVMLHVILALMFVGFATKAGLWPFGDWVPDTYPAAPAPVSAALSGVMSKLGLYGIVRVFVGFLATSAPDLAPAWGWVIGGFGLASALAGGFAACAATDAAVLLAYSSVAQSGIIALGLGAALVLTPAHPVLAALALLAAAFHVVGDAFVKALLFVGSGALQWRTGSRRLEDLGGLFEAMPVTGWCALLGALAIAGFPPLTAFVAKWLLLQATVLSGVPALSVAGLGLLIASLASVLYAIKLFAASFANKPMRPGRLEVPGSMQVSQVLLAAGVVAISLRPGVVLELLARAWASLPALATHHVEVWRGVALAPWTGAFAPLLVLALGAWAALLVRGALGGGPAPTLDAVWTGGVPATRGAPPVHPHGFYAPMREALARAYPAIPWAAPRRPGWIPSAGDPDRWLYRPAAAVGRRATDVLRRVHTGVPHVYLAWQLAGAAALVLLLLALLAQGR